jgi:hypothetical protein
MSDFLASLIHLAGDILRLQADALVWLAANPQGNLLALALAFLAGFSLMIGQSVALFANRVPPRRFTLRLLPGALGYGISLLVWAGCIWLVETHLLGGSLSFQAAALLVAASQAPLLLAFAIFLPYLGNILITFCKS